MARRGRKKKGMITRKIIFALLFVVVSAALTAGVIWGYNAIAFQADTAAPTFPTTLGSDSQWQRKNTDMAQNNPATLGQSLIRQYYLKAKTGSFLEIYGTVNKNLSLTSFSNLSVANQQSADSARVKGTNDSVAACSGQIDGQNCYYYWDNAGISQRLNFFVPVVTAVSGQNNGVVVAITYTVDGLPGGGATILSDMQEIVKFIGNGTLPGPRAISAYMANTTTSNIQNATATVSPATNNTAPTSSGLAPGPELTKNTAAGSQTTTSAAATIGVKIPGNDATSYTYKDYVKAVYNFSLRMGGVLVILMIIYAGYIYMTSQGDSAKLTSAKDIMFGSILGFVMLILLGVILQFVGLPTTETLKNTSGVTNSANKTTP